VLLRAARTYPVSGAGREAGVDIVHRCVQPDDRRMAVQNLLAERRLLLLIWDNF
jgi:hypothetical protein